MASKWAVYLDTFSDFSLKVAPQLALHWTFLMHLSGSFAWLCCIVTLLVFAKGSLTWAAAAGVTLGLIALGLELPSQMISLVSMSLVWMLLLRKGITALVLVAQDLEDERKPYKRRY